MVLAPQDSGTSAGTRVMLVTGNEEDQTQLWCLEDADGSARFINKVSGLAIGIANDDMTSGNSLVLTEKSDSSIYQLWNVINKSTSATLEHIAEKAGRRLPPGFDYEVCPCEFYWLLF